MPGPLSRWRAWRDERTVARRPIPDAIWRATLARWPFLRRRNDADLAELRRLATLFVDAKEFHGAGGLRITDAMAVGIAAQACVPVLRFGLAPYAGFVGIVVHRDEVRAARRAVDDDGVVHEWDDALAGEAMHGGPVMLSWRDVVAGGARDGGYNVVIHEFAHVLDMADGASDGVPPLSGGDTARRRWLAVMTPAFEGHVRAADAGRATAIDPYGAEGPDEFFAVASESFFTKPRALRADLPAVYAVLAEYYGQDPAADAAVATVAATGA